MLVTEDSSSCMMEHYDDFEKKTCKMMKETAHREITRDLEGRVGIHVERTLHNQITVNLNRRV